MTGGTEQAECRCNFRQKLVGDGCEVCNPELAEELRREEEMLEEEQRRTQDQV